MKFKNCECGNSTFNTTKTVYHDLYVIIHEGNILDSEDCIESLIQPDEPYGLFSCAKCNPPGRSHGFRTSISAPYQKIVRYR